MQRRSLSLRVSGFVSCLLRATVGMLDVRGFGLNLPLPGASSVQRLEASPLVFIISPDAPQASALAAARLPRRHGAKLIIDLVDLWPELFNVALPLMLRRVGPALFWPFRALRRFVRDQADAVTALCPSCLRHALGECRPGIKARASRPG